LEIQLFTPLDSDIGSVGVRPYIELQVTFFL